MMDRKVEYNKSKILELMSIEHNGEKMFNSLERKIDKLQQFFIESYQAKLNSLITAKGL